MLLKCVYTFIRSDLLISQGTAKDPDGIQPSWLWNKDGILIGVTYWGDWMAAMDSSPL